MNHPCMLSKLLEGKQVASPLPLMSNLWPVPMKILLPPRLFVAPLAPEFILLVFQRAIAILTIVVDFPCLL
jgi:hypothetical protein